MQGKAIWALGFLSFLSGLCAVHAIVLSVSLGMDGIWQPYLIGSITGGIPVYVYLVASILATLIFLGATSSKVVSELSNKALLTEINSRAKNLENGQQLQQSLLESLKARVFLVDESLNTARKEISEKFSNQDKEIKQVYVNLANRFDTKLADAKNGIGKQLGDGFNEQAEMLKEFQATLISRFDTELTDVKNGVTKRLGEIESTMKKHQKRNRTSAAAIAKQSSEIASINLKIASLEDALATPKPQLTSESDPKDVRGIGPKAKEELKEMGITTVEELILADPKVIAEKTTISEKTAEKLQGVAQLSMVPGVEEKDLVLLEEVGVMNRKELADQDPIELGKKINAIFDVCVEKGRISEVGKPTIEEIYSWVKFAKT